MNNVEGPLWQAVKEFQARLGDELSLSPGDRIEVISDDSEYNDGWYLGRNIQSGEAGLYPKAFTQPVPKEFPFSKPSLLRSRSRRLGSGSPVSPKISLPQNINNSKEALPESPNTTTHSTESGGISNMTIGTVSTGISNDRQNSVHKTMDDIDKALQEIANESVTQLPLAQSSNTTSTESFDPMDVESWTPEQVTAYFSYLNFDIDSAGQFQRHKISGAILIELELAYLKELEIESFGTRFEIFKEIEELKMAARNNRNRQTGLMPPPSLRNQQSSRLNHEKFQPTHERKRSQSVDDLSKTPERVNHNRPISQVISPNYLSPNNNYFESPRKAPAPPSFPSPAKSIRVDAVPRASRPTSSIYLDATSPSKGHSRRGSSPFKTHARNASEVSAKDKAHRRHSSYFSFLSASQSNDHKRSSIANKLSTSPKKTEKSHSPFKSDKPLSPLKSPKRRSVSAKEKKTQSPSQEKSQRSASDAFKMKPMKTSQNIRTLTTNRKKQTSAFQEGIRHVTPAEAMKAADFSGWMSKKGSSAMGGWKPRFFTLHNTRLSYFASLNDTKERGLIDITSYSVLPAKKDNDDKLASLYAASTGSGRFVFKVAPPPPGSRKGLTFTQQKVHYFAVDTKEEMRNWMAALMKATIDIDDSVPVVSSCATPTISLEKAKAMLTKAREDAQNTENELAGKRRVDSTPALRSSNFEHHTPKQLPKIDTSIGGLQSPYILASGLSSPSSREEPEARPTVQRSKTNGTNPVPMITKLDGMKRK